MALRCNHCGAPLVAPDDEQPYIACSYCQTVTELPRRKREPAPVQDVAFRPLPAQRVEVEAVRSRKSLGTGGARLVLGVAALAAVAGAVPGLKFLQELSPLPKPVPVSVERTSPASVAGVAVVSSGSTPPASETNSERPRADSPEPRGSKKSSLRGSGGSGATPAPAPTPAPSPSAKVAPTPTDTAPVPPPVPKKLSVSIGGARIEAGDKKYSLKDITSGLQKAKPAVTACYASTLGENPDTAGTLNMGLQIAPAGTTRGVGVTGSFLPSNLISCANRAFLAIKFPATAGESVNIRYAVTLSAK